MSHFLHIKFNIFFSLPIRVFSETVKLFMKTFSLVGVFNPFRVGDGKKKDLKKCGFVKGTSSVLWPYNVESQSCPICYTNLIAGSLFCGYYFDDQYTIR